MASQCISVGKIANLALYKDKGTESKNRFALWAIDKPTPVPTGSTFTYLPFGAIFVGVYKFGNYVFL